jgi:hypothetical protein
MSLTSLNRFSVPTAGAGSNTSLLMPKLKYRFRVSLLGFGVESSVELTKQVQDVTRPKVSFEEMTLDVYNSKVKLAGKYSFENLTLTLRDDASGQVTKTVGQQIQKQFDFMEQASARSGIDYKFQMNIEILDGGNGNNGADVLERWEVYGAYIQNADYGDLAYSENSHATVALTVAFDNAVQFKGATGAGTDRGVGAVVGRTIGEAVTGRSGAQ